MLIGAGAIILSNVKIGDVAIIDADSVVTYDIPPYAVAARNPAKIIRYRYSEEQITKLTVIAWWNWSPKQISDNIALFREKSMFL